VISLIDYGAGNVRSVHKSLTAAGAKVKLVSDPCLVSASDAVVLPGVGAFDDCVNAMKKQELYEATRNFISTGRPFLGICVGYQALFERSDEFESQEKGLGVFKGSVRRFPDSKQYKVPQIGWNSVEVLQDECPIFNGIESGSYFYFVHSYFPQPSDEAIVATTTNYGVSFASSIWHENIYATQFHPEKSQKVGVKMLKNFIDLM
tara:strand:- start:154 stop:768 length:615 start_codon:yes stop_codon:yes gene_type:complete